MRYYEFDKTAARREFQNRNYLFLGVFAGAVLGIPALRYLFVTGFGFDGVPPFIVVLWLVALFAAGIWLLSWRCPRCHNYFFHKSWYHNGFVTRCLHCDLRPDELI